MSRNIRILDRQFIPAGTLVIQQGAFGSRAYMIESGAVQVFVKDEEGNEIVLTELSAGAMVGEMAAMSDGQRSASARTTEDSVLIGISAHDLHTSMRASDGLYKRLMSMVATRMKDTNMKLLQKEQQLADVEKAARLNIENVALHLSAKQDILEKEIAPILSHIKLTQDALQAAEFKEIQ